MIKSMTGYGSSKGMINDLEFSVELKSVNNKFLDVSVHVPRGYIFVEDIIRGCVQQHITRGKVDVFVSVDSTMANDVSVNVNKPLLKGYIDAVNEIAEQFGLANDVSAYSASRYPDVLSLDKEEINKDEIAEGLKALINNALEDFDVMRAKEGNKLELDIKDRLVSIVHHLEKIEAEAPNTQKAYEQKLRKKMDEVLEDKNIDENRIIQEVAIYADHIAIDEETVRLHSHIDQLKSMISTGSPIGRKMDFLIQEFNREANTIGSKCQNSSIAHEVVDMKSDIEKMREQVQNIE